PPDARRQQSRLGSEDSRHEEREKADPHRPSGRQTGKGPDQLVLRRGPEEARDLHRRRERIGPRELHGGNRHEQKDYRLEVLEDDDREESPRQGLLIAHLSRIRLRAILSVLTARRLSRREP